MNDKIEVEQHFSFFYEEITYNKTRYLFYIHHFTRLVLMKTIKWHLLLCSLIAFIMQTTNAQDYPATMKMGVTFYDFHADGSNPEFEVKHIGSIRKNMVDSILDSDRKPVVGPTPYFNNFIHKWFRPWAAGDFTRPIYRDTFGQLIRIATVNYDTSFKNLVFIDSLDFTHLSNGTYVFESQSFFMLDDKGFKNDASANRNHNFAFTMELHSEFTYKPDLVFEFSGDDDVWAFINGKLAMDLGGIHKSEDGSIRLNDIANSFGLEVGKSYKFDFFYAERHTHNSTIKITTNLFSPPSFLRLYDKGTAPSSSNPPISNLNLKAGITDTIYGHAFDSTYTLRPEWDSLITWQLIDGSNNPPITISKGGFTVFSPTEAYDTVTLVARFKNPDDPLAQVVETRLSVVIQPGAAHHLSLQRTSNAMENPRDDVPLVNVEIPEGQKSTKVYAAVRDMYGNYVGWATNAVWSSDENAIATAQGGATLKYEGTITRALNAGSTMIRVTQTGLLPDSVNVVVYGRAISLQEATTNDVDGDGYLDRIVLKFDSTVSISSAIPLANFSIVYNGTKFPVEKVAAADNGTVGTIFYITLTEQKTKELQTGWTPKITMSGIAGIAPVSNFDTKDGAGPVIQQAQFFPAPLGSGERDTIKITLSEQVNFPGQLTETDFIYYSNNIVKTDMFDSLYTEGQKPYALTGGGTAKLFDDSLQLSHLSIIRDLTGNKPPENGRKAPLESGALATIRTALSSNPVNLTNPLPPTIVTKYQNVISKSAQDPAYQNSTISTTAPKGLIIGVQTKKPLQPISGRPDVYGTATIYDVTGNVVIANIPVSRAERNDYGSYWNGRNGDGRVVGNGTYLVVMKFTYTDGEKESKRLKIGFRNKE